MNLLDITAPVYDDEVYAIFEHKYTQYLNKGGRGSAKSSLLSEAIPPLMIQNPNVNALILRKVGTTLKDSVYNQMLWAIDTLDLNRFFKATKNPLEIQYKPTGQKIYFRGADDPLKIKSIKPDKGYIGITWFEELDQFSGEEEIRNILQSTNRGGNLFWNFFSFNPPKSRDNWANQYAEQIRDDRLTVHSTYLDVPREWLGDQFFIEADILKELNPKAYEHEYLGEATGTGGAVFDNIEDRTITDAEINTFGNFYYGIDYGFAVDPFTWVKLAYDNKKRELYVIDEIYQTQMSNRRAVELIKQRQPLNAYITADSAEPKSIAEMNELGLKVIGAKKGVDSVHYGIDWLQNLTKIVIDRKRCPNAYREFSCYEYETDKYGNFISRFPDKNNHCLTGDTLVCTTKGQMPIEKLVDTTGFLWCYDTENNITAVSKYCNVRKTRENVKILHIEFDNGNYLDCTDDHLILTKQRGYVQAKDLTEADDIITVIPYCAGEKYTYQRIIINQCYYHDEPQDVYDLEVPKYHNFAVNDGIIVHNCIDATRYALETYISNRKVGILSKAKLGVY